MLAWISVRSVTANAEPPCNPHNEAFFFTLAEVTYNGQATTRGTDRFFADGGVEFYGTPRPQLDSLAATGTACGTAANSLTLLLTDPTSNQTVSVMLVTQ